MTPAKQILHAFIWLICIMTMPLLKIYGFIGLSWFVVLLPLQIYMLIMLLIIGVIGLRYWHDYRALTRAFEEYMDATDPADVLVAEEKWKKIDKLFGAEEPKE